MSICFSGTGVPLPPDPGQELCDQHGQQGGNQRCRDHFLQTDAFLSFPTPQRPHSPGIQQDIERDAGKPEIKLTTDPEQYGELISVQERILSNAFEYVKPGGRVEYSTCTLNKNENEKVVKDMLSKKGSSARIIEMETLLPYNGKVGFFYSIIEKTAN